MNQNTRSVTRRQFTHALLAAPAFISPLGKTKRLPLAFSTLGCPQWEWKKIIEHAAQHGYAALELRGLLDQMDLTKCPEFGGTRLKQTLRDLTALDLRVSDLGASANMHLPDSGADAAKRSAQMDEAKRFITLAHELKAPYVRVFPNNWVKGEERQVTVARIVAGLRELGDYAKGSGVQVLVESHGDFTDSKSLLEIVAGANHPGVAFLWDAHHTCVAGEKPTETFKQLSRFVRHTHLKDSRAPRPGENGRRYVLTGTGDVPVRETVRVLAAGGYRGYYCLEWEKRWHPEIEDPEIAFPHYAKVMRDYLLEAGVKA